MERKGNEEKRRNSDQKGKNEGRRSRKQMSRREQGRKRRRDGNVGCEIGGKKDVRMLGSSLRKERAGEGGHREDDEKGGKNVKKG